VIRKKNDMKPARAQKSLSIESAMHMPSTSSGKFDWEGVAPKSFVIVPINNKKSSLHGRFVILEKMENGLYRVAKREKSEDSKEKEKKESIEDRRKDVEHVEKYNVGAAMSRRSMVNSTPGGNKGRSGGSLNNKMPRSRKSLSDEETNRLALMLKKALKKWQ